jgi:hypothetical protein
MLPAERFVVGFGLRKLWYESRLPELGTYGRLVLFPQVVTGAIPRVGGAPAGEFGPLIPRPSMEA